MKNLVLKIITTISLLILIINSTYARDLETLQKDFLSWKFGMFLHFNMATFNPGGWSNGKEDPALFNPEKLDFTQWADAAVSANMKYGVLTVKHTGGWSLWKSPTSERDISDFKNYKDGEGDIVAEFAEAFRSRNLKVGLYYCFPLFTKTWADYNSLAVPGYAQGNADALNFIKNQFTELLTNYGPVDMIWVDQSASKNGGLKKGDWKKIKNHIHSLQPNTIVVANNQINYETTDIHSYEYPYSLELPSLGNNNAAEVADKLQRGWFTNPKGESVPVRTQDYVVNKMLRPLNKINSNYLLNVAPNTDGLIPQSVVALLADIGKEWRPGEAEKSDDDFVGITRKTISAIPNNKSLVSLVFDISTSTEQLEAIIELLAKHDLLASFVVSNNTLDKVPTQLQSMVKQGHELINGAMNNVDLSQLDKGRSIRDAIEPIQKTLLKLVQQKPLLFKSPANVYSDKVWNVLNYQGLIAVNSSVLVNSNTEFEAIKSGSIIELAISHRTTETLDKLLPTLKAKGLKPVTIGQVIDNSSKQWIREKSLNKANIVTGMQ